MLSIADWEIEEPPEDNWCSVHQVAYATYCGACLADEADRKYDLRRDERDTQP